MIFKVNSLLALACESRSFLFTPIVIQSEAKNLDDIYVDVIEIFRTRSSTTRLPPFGRLNDKIVLEVFVPKIYLKE